MTIYRKSFWNSHFKLLFFFLIISLTIGTAFYIELIIGSLTGGINPFNNTLGVLLFSVLPFMFIAIIILKLTEYNYLVLSEDRLIIKRMFFPFHNKAYRYSEIESCILGNSGGISPDYIQFKINGRWTWKLINKLALVDQKDYPELIAELSSKGVEIFTRGIK